MLRPRRLFVDHERALEQRLGIAVPSELLIERCEVVEGSAGFGMA
jgi:hypothetical protein